MGRLYPRRPGGPNARRGRASVTYVFCWPMGPGEAPRRHGGHRVLLIFLCGLCASVVFPCLGPAWPGQEPGLKLDAPARPAIVDERDELDYNALCCQTRTWSAEVAELADALRSGRSGHGSCGFKSRPRHCQLSITLRGGAEAARQAHNLEVVGSNPTPATLFLGDRHLPGAGHLLIRDRCLPLGDRHCRKCRSPKGRSPE
jgi:hypothetical protein